LAAGETTINTLRSTAFGLAAAALSLSLAACEEGPTTNVTFRIDDVWQVAQAVMATGPLLVEISGEPYGGEVPGLANKILNDMKRAITWYATPRFTAEAAEAANPSLRIVMTFNGGTALGGRDQCRGRASGGGPLDGGRVEVIATFCDEADVLANVRGRIDRTEDPSDRRFSDLVRQVTRDMLAETKHP
jgi:hypothetical protein